MTNILLLPQLSGGYADDGVTLLQAIFPVATNGDWRAALTFTRPAPNQAQALDITGIKFRAQVKGKAGDVPVLMDLSTDNGLLINGGTNGTLTWAVPTARPSSGPSYCTSGLTGSSAVMDILAIADGMTINLFQMSGPALLKIDRGITD